MPIADSGVKEAATDLPVEELQSDIGKKKSCDDALGDKESGAGDKECGNDEKEDNWESDHES